jgi:aminoglycoside phosphotransferase (APT) family kinase protein
MDFSRASGSDPLPPHILAALRAAGLVGSESPHVTALAGGVSCDIWRVDTGDRVLAIKRALPRLRVRAEWFADPARNRHEQEYLRYVGGFLPESVPRIVFSGGDFFAMEFLGGGFSDWKKFLLAGSADPAVADAAGRTLGRIHRESWGDAAVAAAFGNDRDFFDLRISPYLLTAAERRPELAGPIRAEAARLASTKRALVHGDYSPKNLMVAPGRLVVLDCEVAWFGDPAFDLCFLTNHLLLKSLHLPRLAGAMPGLVAAAHAAYREEIGEDRFAEVSARSPALLLCLLLARVDGKSPAEYLDDPAKKDFVRAFVRHHLPAPPGDLPALVAAWTDAIGSARQFPGGGGFPGCSTGKGKRAAAKEQGTKSAPLAANTLGTQ